MGGGVGPFGAKGIDRGINHVPRINRCLGTFINDVTSVLLAVSYTKYIHPAPSTCVTSFKNVPLPVTTHCPENVDRKVLNNVRVGDRVPEAISVHLRRNKTI